jgi:hypothetical protein
MEHRHRGFGGDPLHRTIQIPIEHQVADDQDRKAGNGQLGELTLRYHK